MSKLMITVYLIVLVGVFIFLSYMYSTRGLMLVAKESVPVYSTASEAMTWPHPAKIAEVNAGQSVPVTKCVDVKHYFIYQVLLPDGRVGFALEGEFTLMRDGKQAACS